METVYRCFAGIDVHKKMLAVVVRREQDGQTTYQERMFGTARCEIEHLAAYLQHEQVTEVVMESTAQYWRPVWYGLESHFRLHLCHPMATRAPRGRKRDIRDARRLVDRLWGGDLEDSFEPGAEQRSWRWLTRTRVGLQEKVNVVRNQVEGLLEEGGIKLAAVVSDLFGVSGWAILERIAKGDADVEALLGEARGTLRKKKAELKEALVGRLHPVYQTSLKQHLEQVKLLCQQIEEVNRLLGERMKEYAPVLNRLCRMPGVDLGAAQQFLAEIGPTAESFGGPEQFVSWVGICPGSQESAGINYSHRSAKGNRYLRRLLCQVAWAAVHTKDTFFASLFQRLKPRVEAKGAAWAVGHRMAKIIWRLLHEGVEYEEKGPAAKNPDSLKRKFRRLLKDFERLGIDPTTLMAQGVPAE